MKLGPPRAGFFLWRYAPGAVQFGHALCEPWASYPPQERLGLREWGRASRPERAHNLGSNLQTQFAPEDVPCATLVSQRCLATSCSRSRPRWRRPQPLRPAQPPAPPRPQGPEQARGPPLAWRTGGGSSWSLWWWPPQSGISCAVGGTASNQAGGIGDRGRARTCTPQLRRLMLYPVERRGRKESPAPCGRAGLSLTDGLMTRGCPPARAACHR